MLTSTKGTNVKNFSKCSAQAELMCTTKLIYPYQKGIGSGSLVDLEKRQNLAKIQLFEILRENGLKINVIKTLASKQIK